MWRSWNRFLDVVCLKLSFLFHKFGRNWFLSLSLFRVWNTGWEGCESRENVAGFMLLCLPSHLACPVNEVRNTMVLRCWWPLPILAPPLPAPGKSRSRSFFLLLLFPSVSFPTRSPAALSPPQRSPCFRLAPRITTFAHALYHHHHYHRRSKVYTQLGNKNFISTDNRYTVGRT